MCGPRPYLLHTIQMSFWRLHYYFLHGYSLWHLLLLYLNTSERSSLPSSILPLWAFYTAEPLANSSAVFNVFINGLGNGAKRIFVSFSDDTDEEKQLTLWKAGLQHLHSLEEWASRNIGTLGKTELKVLLLGWNKPIYAGPRGTGSSSAEQHCWRRCSLCEQVEHK